MFFLSTCYQCDFLYLLVIGLTCFLNKPFLYLGKYFVSSFSVLLSFILHVSLFLYGGLGKGKGKVAGEGVGWWESGWVVIISVRFFSNICDDEFGLTDVLLIRWSY